MDLIGPTKTLSLGRKICGFMIVDDYQRYTWLLFLSTNDEAFDALEPYVEWYKMEKV